MASSITVDDELQPMDTDVDDELIVDGVKKTVQNKYKDKDKAQLDEQYSVMRTWFEKARSEGYCPDATA